MTAPAEPDRYAEREFRYWLFLMSDAVLFALLFATYAVLVDGTAGGPTGRDLFSLPRTFAATMVLLLSSTTFGFAALASRAGDPARDRRLAGADRPARRRFLALTLGEFFGMLAAGAGPQRSGFLSAFFVLVGTHAVHVAAGLACLLVMLAQLRLKGLTAPVLSRLHRLGLFWHFLDIVRIGVFSVVYLLGLL